MLVPALLRQILYGLILLDFLIQMLDGHILKFFWQVLKYERVFFNGECSDKITIKKVQQLSI